MQTNVQHLQERFWQGYLTGFPIDKQQASFLSDSLYGISCFTSVSIENGFFPFWKEHCERLSHSFHAINGVGLDSFNNSWQSNILLQLSRMHATLKRVYVRITLIPVFSEKSLFSKSIKDVAVKIIVRDMPARTGMPEGASAEVLTKEHSLFLDDPYCKVGNYLKERIDFNKIKTHGVDDIIYVSKTGKLLEASTSNLLLSSNDKWFFPMNEKQCLNGITRNILRTALKENNKIVVEEEVDLSKVDKTWRIYLLNQVRRIVPLKKILLKNDVIEFETSEKEWQFLDSTYDAEILKNHYRISSESNV